LNGSSLRQVSGDEEGVVKAVGLEEEVYVVKTASGLQGLNAKDWRHANWLL